MEEKCLCNFPVFKGGLRGHSSTRRAGAPKPPLTLCPRCPQLSHRDRGAPSQVSIHHCKPRPRSPPRREGHSPRAVEIMVPGQTLDLEEVGYRGFQREGGLWPGVTQHPGAGLCGESQGRGPSMARKTLPVWRCEALSQDQSRVMSVVKARGPSAGVWTGGGPGSRVGPAAQPMAGAVPSCWKNQAGLLPSGSFYLGGDTCSCTHPHTYVIEGAQK